MEANAWLDVNQMQCRIYQELYYKLYKKILVS